MLQRRISLNLLKYETSVTVLTHHHRADNLPGTALSLLVKDGCIRGHMPQAISFSSPAQLGNNCLFFSACSFYLVLLLSDFPTYPFPVPLQHWLWMLVAHCVSPQVVTWVLQLWSIPDPRAFRDQSILLPETAPGAMLVLAGSQKNATHTHTNKHNPCADGEKEQNQNHISLIEQRLRKDICFWNATSLACFSETYSN